MIEYGEVKNMVRYTALESWDLLTFLRFVHQNIESTFLPKKTARKLMKLLPQNSHDGVVHCWSPKKNNNRVS